MPLKTAIIYANSVERWAKHYKLDPDWVTAMYSVESHWNANACDNRPRPSYGIPQIQVQTAQLIVDSWGHSFKISPWVLKLYPGLSIHLSCAHLAHLFRAYNGDTIKATRAYNAGETAINSSPKLPGMPYFEKVLHQYKLYKLN